MYNWHLLKETDSLEGGNFFNKITDKRSQTTPKQTKTFSLLVEGAQRLMYNNQLCSMSTNIKQTNQKLQHHGQSKRDAKDILYSNLTCMAAEINAMNFFRVNTIKYVNKKAEMCKKIGNLDSAKRIFNEQSSNVSK